MRNELVALLVLVACKGDHKPATGSGSSPSPTGAAGASAAKFEACNFVNAKDVEALFGHPATQKKGPTTELHGECRWDYDAPDNSSELLQLIIWTEDFYKQGGEMVDPDAQPFEIGERKGNIKASDATGIDVAWVQGGRYINFSYSTVGPSVPKATTKVEEVKVLAKKVSAAL